MQWNIVQAAMPQEGGYTTEWQQADFGNEVINRCVYRWPTAVALVLYSHLSHAAEVATILDGMNGLQ